MFFLTLLTFFLPCNAGEKEEGKRYYAFTPQISSAEGELALLENGKNKKIYALLIRVGTGSFPFLYVKGEEEKIRRWKGRNVKITGPLFWEKGLDRPVLLPQKLEPAWRIHN